MNPEKPSENHGTFKKFLFFLKFLEIRLRFVLILVITALVVGYWDNVQNYYERWQRNRAGNETGLSEADKQAESEFEFFCPMHPFVIRGHKDKCPVCGMDLVQRKKGAPMELPEGTLARVQVSPDRVMQAGIQVEPVVYHLLTRTVRTYGVIEPDETRVARISARFPGRIEKQLVNTVGVTVKKGDPLAEIYSPKFLAAIQEYVQALKAEQRIAQAAPDERQRAAQLTAFARQRLALAGFTEEQLNRIQPDEPLQNTVTLYAPLAGTVLDKAALPGETVTEEATLYTIADLSQVWVQALVIESDVSAVRVGMPVEVSSVSYPGEIFYGTVNFISPTVNPENRSVRVRVVVDNAAGKLKPGMYVTTVVRSPIGQYGPVDKIPGGEPAPADPPTMSVPETGSKQVEHLK
jgi:Cu(I)/Ag(I) efflux system membrane fusion protein